MTGEGRVRIELDIPQAAIMLLPVVVDGGEQDDYLPQTVTVGELVARQIVAQAGVFDLRDAIWAEVQAAIKAVVGKSLTEKPTADGTIASMIAAELTGQTGPPGRYHGTATPLRQWVSGEVYKALREQATPEISGLIADISQAVNDYLLARGRRL